MNTTKASATLPDAATQPGDEEASEPTWETAFYESAAQTRNAADALGSICEPVTDPEASPTSIATAMKSALALVIKDILILVRWSRTVSKLEELQERRDIILHWWTEIVRLHNVAQTLEAADKERVKSCGELISQLRARIDDILRSGIVYRGLKASEVGTMLDFTLAMPQVVVLATEVTEQAANESASAPGSPQVSGFGNLVVTATQAIFGGGAHQDCGGDGKTKDKDRRKKK